ncbi:MAG: M20/M25/M40 family metallo-hydrolase [Phycisphaeraceae bacterium]
MREREKKTLLELTGLPTAAGREDRVIEWVETWAKRRRGVTLKRDTYGNLTIQRKGARSKSPIYFTAHLDHPAFVVTDVLDVGKHVQAEFRGGVHDDYFVGTRVMLDLPGKKQVRGTVVSLDRKRSAELPKLVTIEFDRIAPCVAGDVVTWALPKAKISKGRLHAPACDDLAAVAAAVCAYDKLLKQPKGLGDVRLLFTRAEEVGFVGAIAAAKAGTMPKGSTLVCLENSKSMAESPIGGGPIIRVGDRISIFDPDLTARLNAVAEGLAKRDKSFRFQRKLMPGGACEATAFRALGYLSSCICLPLGNYHNMDEDEKAIAPESIAVDDYYQMIDLLAEVGRELDQTRAQEDLVERLERLLERGRAMLD